MITPCFLRYPNVHTNLPLIPVLLFALYTVVFCKNRDAQRISQRERGRQRPKPAWHASTGMGVLYKTYILHQAVEPFGNDCHRCALHIYLTHAYLYRPLFLLTEQVLFCARSLHHPQPSCGADFYCVSHPSFPSPISSYLISRCHATPSQSSPGPTAATAPRSKRIRRNQEPAPVAYGATENATGGRQRLVQEQGQLRQQVHQ